MDFPKDQYLFLGWTTILTIGELLYYICATWICPYWQGFKRVRVNRQFQIDKKRGSIKKGEYHKK